MDDHLVRHSKFIRDVLSCQRLHDRQILFQPSPIFRYVGITSSIGKLSVRDGASSAVINVLANVGHLGTQRSDACASVAFQDRQCLRDPSHSQGAAVKLRFDDFEEA
ncbi:MAG: hypothetical protein BGO79_24610 [Delftia sp. 67-8]|nr:MAG: hypothetical protein BGO79_24610 [Delftia sp. 67-8]